MINEGKVMLMTKIAIYEKKEENHDLVLSRYFKEDYVKFGCLRTLVAVTLCYWIFVGVYILINFENILNDLMDMDYFDVMGRFLKGYALCCLIFFVYAFIVYTIRYQMARRGMTEYNKTLRKLLKYYEIEQREIDKMKKRFRVYDSVGGDEEALPMDSDNIRRQDS